MRTAASSHLNDRWSPFSLITRDSNGHVYTSTAVCSEYTQHAWTVTVKLSLWTDEHCVLSESLRRSQDLYSSSPRPFEKLDGRLRWSDGGLRGQGANWTGRVLWPPRGSPGRVSKGQKSFGLLNPNSDMATSPTGLWLFLFLLLKCSVWISRHR